MILVDTDILIDASRGKLEVITCLKNIQTQFGLAISVVTEMELIVGCRDKAELRKLDAFLQRF